MSDYIKAIALDPSSSYAHYNCGIVRDRQGDFVGAVACFTAAINLEPQNADFHHNRGFSYRKMVSCGLAIPCMVAKFGT